MFSNALTFFPGLIFGTYRIKDSPHVIRQGGIITMGSKSATGLNLSQPFFSFLVDQIESRMSGYEQITSTSVYCSASVLEILRVCTDE